MLVYIYNHDYTFKRETQSIPGVNYANSTKLKPDLENYPLESFIVKFNTELNKWDYIEKVEEVEETKEEIDPEKLKVVIDLNNKIRSLETSKKSMEQLATQTILSKDLYEKEKYDTVIAKLRDNVSKYKTKIEAFQKELDDANERIQRESTDSNSET